MISTSYIDAFVPAGCDSASCVECGICLQMCPEMKMEPAESRLEMKRLLDGEEPERVFGECTFCYSCNSYCPQGLRPYNLIMERMVAKNRQSEIGIPAAVEYMMTGKHDTGYFYDQYKAGSAEDKAILDRWAALPGPAKDTLFIGCVGRTMPQHLEHSKTLARLPKFAPRDACCGEIPHRFGDYAYFSELVERTHEQLSVLPTERLVCYCGSCANYLGNVWPNYHGIKLPFPVISLYEWLWEKYQRGDLEIERIIEKQIAISDSCYTSELGDDFYSAIRGLLKAAGMEPIELANSRHDSLCCGFACGIRNNYDQAQVAFQAQKKLQQILATEATSVAVNCPGCYASIAAAVTSAAQDLSVRFAISDILWSFGDHVTRK